MPRIAISFKQNTVFYYILFSIVVRDYIRCFHQFKRPQKRVMAVQRKDKEIDLSEIKGYVFDIVEIKGKVGRIEDHMKGYKEAHIEFNSIQVKQTKILDEIYTFIKGNDLSNNKGMAHEFDDMQEQLQKQHDNQIRYEVYFKLFGVALVLVTSGMITALVKIFTS